MIIYSAGGELSRKKNPTEKIIFIHQLERTSRHENPYQQKQGDHRE